MSTRPAWLPDPLPTDEAHPLASRIRYAAQSAMTRGTTVPPLPSLAEAVAYFAAPPAPGASDADL